MRVDKKRKVQCKPIIAEPEKRSEVNQTASLERLGSLRRGTHERCKGVLFDQL